MYQGRCLGWTFKRNTEGGETARTMAVSSSMRLLSSSFRGFTPTRPKRSSTSVPIFFSTPSRTPRGKSIIPSRLSPLRNTCILSNSSLPLNPTKHQKVGQTYFLMFDISPCAIFAQQSFGWSVREIYDEKFSIMKIVIDQKNKEQI